MTSNFATFAQLVAEGFQATAQSGRAFVTSVDGDSLYERYLQAFPEGTNPIFRKRTEHDCSCCRHFIRRAGNVVGVAGDKICTIWDGAATKAPKPYREVAAQIREMVMAAPISDIFCVSQKETSFGAEQSHSFNDETQEAQIWNHFYTGPIPSPIRRDSPDWARGDYRTRVQVLTRGLVELKLDAVETVLSLVEAGSLYRGEEHQLALVEFHRLQRWFRQLSAHEQALFVWANAHLPSARFRNTVIGTLVQDLSEGMDLEQAVASFESKVAPQNYKRTTALITPAMVKKAMETIRELDLEPALERRLARLSDISVNDVKWADGTVKPLMKDGLGEMLMKHAVEATGVKVDADRAEQISLDDFMAQILPETTSMELLFKGEHLGNLMVLTAPVHPEPKQLFRWNNDFAWTYGGNVADSIKERVKKAGGRVEGALLRVSLSWFNYDDLDLHILEPEGDAFGREGRIYYGHRRGQTGGELDVDMNAGYGSTREPVENVVWTRRMPDGPYRVVVDNFCRRETTDPGFVIEVESGGKLSHFSYNKAVRDQGGIHVVTLHVKNGVIERMEVGDQGISATSISQEKWGLKTEQFVKVSAVSQSPNYWGNNAVGNKHTFFILEGCRCDEPMRGIFNEFLHPRLEPHRKVFEVIGDTTKCQPVEDQIAGLGFSSTRRATFLVRVHQGKKQRLFNVKVGQ